MTIDERVNNVKKRLDFMVAKALSGQEAHDVLVWIVKASRQDGAEAEREACAMIANKLEYKEDFMYWQAVASEIEKQIRARSEGEEIKPLSFAQEIREEANRVWDIGKRIEAKEASKKDDPRIWYEIKQAASDLHTLARKLKARSEGEKKGE